MEAASKGGICDKRTITEVIEVPGACKSGSVLKHLLLPAGRFYMGYQGVPGQLLAE
jgi:hypothetical protein